MFSLLLLNHRIQIFHTYLFHFNAFSLNLVPWVYFPNDFGEIFFVVLVWIFSNFRNFVILGPPPEIPSVLIHIRLPQFFRYLPLYFVMDISLNQIICQQRGTILGCWHSYLVQYQIWWSFAAALECGLDKRPEFPKHPSRGPLQSLPVSVEVNRLASSTAVVLLEKLALLKVALR